MTTVILLVFSFATVNYSMGVKNVKIVVHQVKHAMHRTAKTVKKVVVPNGH